LALTIQPNPFNGTTQINADVIEGEQSTIEVYDLVGNKVVGLYDGIPQSSKLSLIFDGRSFASGSYLVRVSSGGNVVTRKIELLK
jgi:hypothetical protein